MNRQRFREMLAWAGVLSALFAAGQTYHFVSKYLTESRSSEMASVRMLATPSHGEEGEKSRTGFVQAVAQMNDTGRMMMLVLCADIIAMIVLTGFEKARVRERLDEPAYPPPTQVFSRLVMGSACLFACIAPWVARSTLPF
jgi:hypothetical protein